MWCSALTDKLRCVFIAPFGGPVVPPVGRIAATASRGGTYSGGSLLPDSMNEARPMTSPSPGPKNPRPRQRIVACQPRALDLVAHPTAEQRVTNPAGKFADLVVGVAPLPCDKSRAVGVGAPPSVEKVTHSHGVTSAFMS